ncbi:MAG: hypothetical protein JF610_15410, partial [Acidobacteria bacterium]|nr:hypothetical protein [Acidobacteriota bacterium]
LLALWRCMDDATWPALTFLAGATAAVSLSNFYGGLIAAVITPFAIATYWVARARFGARPWRDLGVTMAAFAALVAAGLGLVMWHAPALINHRAAFAFTRADLFTYSAKWWGYLVPPVAHPLLGGVARRIWSAARVSDGLLEQQVSLGWSVVALAVVAIQGWISGIDRRAPGNARAFVSPYTVVPVVGALAVIGVVCSLSPERAIFGMRVMRPSAVLYPILPMFRSYARFGIVVQLMTALLAGIGVARLLAGGTRSARAACAALMVLAIAEYTVSPATMSRDVLPTEAHRWVMRQDSGWRVFDCSPVTLASEPQIAARLQADGFTHMLVATSWQRAWLRQHPLLSGVRPEAQFEAADVLSLDPRTLIYTRDMTGFSAREHDDRTTWRWMGDDASWLIVTPTPSPHVRLRLDLRAFHIIRPMKVQFDDGQSQQLDVDPEVRTYIVGPFALSAGSHRLTFHSIVPASGADAILGNGDPRALSIAVGSWEWITR